MAVFKDLQKLVSQSQRGNTRKEVQPRYKRLVFITRPAPESPQVYKCDLCESSPFPNEDELSKHVAANH